MKVKPAPASKYFQDPVYGPIPVASPTLLRLIDSRAVQRLKHVRQLGTSFFTFLGAEHSRFSHSLGCLHLMGVVLGHLEREEGLRLGRELRDLALASALLHDVGHCAFSHTLEGVLGYHHEAMTVRLIQEDPQLKGILGSAARPVAGLIEGRRGSGIQATLKDLVSSQLDVDRLDYLVRDAHHTGLNSGAVDVPRIVSNFALDRGKLVVRERGSLAVEEYFLARYFMYWKVYFHKTSRCLELILRALLKRARFCLEDGSLSAASLSPALAQLFRRGAGVGVRAFLDHDDSDVLVAIKAWQYEKDPILRDLAGRFLNRRKFKLLREARSLDELLSPRQTERIRAFLEERRPGSAEYYFFEDRFGDLPYDPQDPVYLLSDSGSRLELSARSELIQGITRKLVHARYYVPHEVEEDIKKLLKKS
jgi:HD superfamily phosphohydrolase